mmetsp:Transcript_78574/g.228055  ORF Transcript_78574/g.228055 Transcript_78574/m.228055 type:complete len:314 (+) Transcript_78574:278-1219(+)
MPDDTAARAADDGGGLGRHPRRHASDEDGHKAEEVGDRRTPRAADQPLLQAHALPRAMVRLFLGKAEEVVESVKVRVPHQLEQSTQEPCVPGPAAELCKRRQPKRQILRLPLRLQLLNQRRDREVRRPRRVHIRPKADRVEAVAEKLASAIVPVERFGAHEADELAVQVREEAAHLVVVLANVALLDVAPWHGRGPSPHRHLVATRLMRKPVVVQLVQFFEIVTLLEDLESLRGSGAQVPAAFLRRHVAPQRHGDLGPELCRVKSQRRHGLGEARADASEKGPRPRRFATPDEASEESVQFTRRRQGVHDDAA